MSLARTKWILAPTHHVITVFEKMEEAQESMDCSDSVMIASSPKEEAGPEQEDIPDIPEIGMEQDVAADPGDSKGMMI